MNDRKIEDIFWSLFHCNGEDEVQKFIKENSLLNNQNNWKPYGNNQNNFGIFENQQSHSVAALTEKLTNSIDSMLMKECRLKGIDPESSEAPNSLEDAMDVFFNIKNNELGELAAEKRKKLSLNIQLIATGHKDTSGKNGDLLVFDNAEGQLPSDFPNTFLSLAQNNKNKIKFVQGKFNMGSTGAIIFCGNNRYQLIGSKLNPKLLEDSYKLNKFGFTLVRKHYLNEDERDQYKSTWYEYFTIESDIASFSTGGMDLGLHEKRFKSGTVIKLYSYELPKGCKGNIRGRLQHVLNQILYKPALPFLLMDKRYPTKESLTTFTVSGNNVRLENSTKDILEINPIYLKSESGIGDFTIKIFILKHEKENFRNYIGDFPVSFVIDGKIHGHKKKAFIAEDLKLSFLKNYLLIYIDCTRLETNFRQDIFMANRWGLRSNDKFNEFQEKIIALISDNSELRRLNNEKKNKILYDGSKNDNDSEIIKKMLTKNPATENLKDLLEKLAGLKVPNKKKYDKSTKNKSSQSKDKKKDNLTTKRFPSIFKIKLKKDKSEKLAKGIPLGGEGKVEFETDVEDNYFYRPIDKGELEIKILGHERKGGNKPLSKGLPRSVKDIFDVDRTGPENHSIRLTFKPKNILQVNDEIKLNARLTCPDQDLEVIFYIRIDKKKEEEKGKKKTIKKENNSSYPGIIKIKKKDDKWIKVPSEDIWEEEGWSEDSVIDFIEESHGILAIVVNLDSHILKKIISKYNAKNETQVNYIRYHYIYQIYVHGLFLYHSINQSKKNSEIQKREFISNCFKLLYGEALINMYFLENEKKLKIYGLEF